MSATPRAPGQWQICSRCSGDGKHSIGMGAMSLEAFRCDFSPEEQDAYLAGGYDSVCECCEGSGKVRTDADSRAEARELAAERRTFLAESGIRGEL